MTLNKKNKFLLVLATICLSVFIAGALHIRPDKKAPTQVSISALFPQMDLGFLTTEADYIIIGKVKAVKPARLAKDSKDELTVLTDYEIAVENDLKNPDSPEKTMVISQTGGSAEGYKMSFTNKVDLEQGERVILFIHQGEGVKSIIGAYQGKYKLENGKAINFDNSKSSTEDDLINNVKEKIKQNK